MSESPQPLPYSIRFSLKIRNQLFYCFLKNGIAVIYATPEKKKDNNECYIESS
jgi:hypothetical protein